jgi:hypothetical protein
MLPLSHFFSFTKEINLKDNIAAQLSIELIEMLLFFSMQLKKQRQKHNSNMTRVKWEERDGHSQIKVGKIGFIGSTKTCMECREHENQNWKGNVTRRLISITK